MPHRSVSSGVVLPLLALGALVQAGACRSFEDDSRSSSDGGAGVFEEVDAVADVDVLDASLEPGRVILRGTAQAGPVDGNMPLSLSLPPGTQPGDLMLLALFSSHLMADPKFATDGGATQWVRRFSLNAQCKPDAGPSATGTFIVQSRIVTSAEASGFSVTFDVTSTGKDRATAILSVWGATDPTSPIDTEVFAGAPDLVAPELTTTVPNTHLTALFASSTAAGAVWTAPAGMTTRASTGLLALFDEPLESVGPTGTRAAQTTATDTCGAAAMLALRPRP